MAKCHLSWDSYQKNISSGLADLQQHEEFVDMTIAAAGHLVKVHRNLLALASPYIKAMLQSAPCPHPVIFLSNISEETLAHILEYVYTGEVLMPTQKMDEFLKACQDLHIIGVENVKPPKLPPDNGDKVSNERHQQQTKITNNNILTNARLLIETTKAKKRKLDQCDEDLKITATAENTTLELIDTNTEIDSVDRSKQQTIDKQDEIAKAEAIAQAERLRNMIEQNDATEIEVDIMEDYKAHQPKVDLVEVQQQSDNLVEDSLIDHELIDSHAVNDDIANIKVKTCDVLKTSDQTVTRAPNSENLVVNVRPKRKFVKKKIIPQRCYILRRTKINADKQTQEIKTTQASEQTFEAENENAVISKTIIARKASDIKIKKINDTFRLVTTSKENTPCKSADDATVSENYNPKIEPLQTEHPTNASLDFEQSIGTHIIDANKEIVNLDNNITQDGKLLDPVNDLLFIPTTAEDENITSMDTFSHNYLEKDQAFDAVTDLPFIPTSPINEIATSNTVDYDKPIEMNSENVNIDIGPNYEYNNTDEPYDFMDVEQSITNDYADQNITFPIDMIENTDQSSSHNNDIVAKAENKCQTYEDCVKELIEGTSTNEIIEETSSNEDTIIKEQSDSVPDNGALYNVNVELPGGSQSMPKITVLTSKVQNHYMPMLLMEHVPVSKGEESTPKPQLNIPDPNDLIASTSPLFMVNGYSKLQMILNRYIYCVHHVSKQNLRWRWRCIDYRHHHCRAYVDTVAGLVVGRVNYHEHPFHDKKILKLGQNRRVFSSLKEIQEIVGEPMDQLVHLDLGFLNNLNDLPALPDSE